MGLKGYMLWVMGQLDSTCRAPPQVAKARGEHAADEQVAHRDVALQVAFERQTLKPVFHLIGVRLWV